MTDVFPPPPPPSPPPPRPASIGFDFVRPFAYVFEDPRWLPKVLIGGLFVLASFVLVGVFFLLGYIAQLVRNVIAGVKQPLPEWDNLGEYFGEGLLLFCVTFIYALPIVLLSILIGVPAAIMSNVDNEGVRNIGGGALGCAWCLVVPFSLVITFFVPAALLMVVTTRRFGAAFEFRRILDFVKANIGNYLLAIAIYVVARFVASFGIILFCVGIVFTEFWGMVVSGFAFGEVYRLSERR